MRDERFEVSVTFDERRGYIVTAPELRQPVLALSLGGLRNLRTPSGAADLVLRYRITAAGPQCHSIKSLKMTTFLRARNRVICPRTEWRPAHAAGQSQLLFEGRSLRCGLRLIGIFAIHAHFWPFRSFGLAVFRTYHLVPLQLAGFLTPAIVGALGHPNLTGRIGNALTSRDQNVNLA